MTCIAGLVTDGIVHLAGDSAGCSGWDLTVRADVKVFVSGPYVMGFTHSFRMGQVLRYAFTPPVPSIAEDLHGFMCTAFIDGVRACLKEAGWASKDKEKEEGGCFLAGVAGRLFRVEADYQVAESADGFDAVGCGGDAARGALFATAGQDPRSRLEMALGAAERFSNGVRGPFTIVSSG